MTTFDRANQLAEEIAALGIRATVEPVAAVPPCVLITPPERRFDVGCGFTARWTLAAIAPGALGADRTTWDALDLMAEAVSDVVDLESVQPVAYVLNGQQLPTYLLIFEEALS